MMVSQFLRELRFIEAGALTMRETMAALSQFLRELRFIEAT